MQPLRPRCVARLPSGDSVNMGYLLGQGSGVFRLRQEGRQHLLCTRGQLTVTERFWARRMPLLGLVRGLLFGVLVGVLRRGAVRHGFHCRAAGYTLTYLWSCTALNDGSESGAESARLLPRPRA